MAFPDCNWPDTGEGTDSVGQVRSAGKEDLRIEGRGECPNRSRNETYLAVLVLFCFGFLGVLAFLSTSTSRWVGSAYGRNPSAARALPG